MKPLEQKKHREFWIDPSDELEKDDGCEFEETIYTALSSHPGQGPLLWQSNLIHVIEASALLEMEKRAEELVKALEFYAGDNYDSVYEDDEMDLNRLLDREDVSFDETDKHFGCAGSKARQALEKWRQR